MLAIWGCKVEHFQAQILPLQLELSCVFRGLCKETTIYHVLTESPDG